MYIPAAHTSPGTNLPPNRIVIHGTVSPTVRGGARAIAHYFAGAGAGGSAHYVIDPGEIVQCVKDSTIAWHAPPNFRSLAVELTDWVTLAEARRHDRAWVGKSPAQWAARWTDRDHQSMLRLAAGLVSCLCSTYSLPEIKLTSTDLIAGGRGICGHVDVSRAWYQTNHIDPGADFPWTQFIGYVTSASDRLAVPPFPGPSTPSSTFSPATLAYQRRLRDRGWSIVADGIHGPKTSDVIRRFEHQMNLPLDSIGSRIVWIKLWIAPIT